MDKEKEIKEPIEPTTKEILSIEYSVPMGMSNEEVLWFLHLIAADSDFEQGELQGKQLRLVLYEMNWPCDEE